jgi:FlaA1/EpsC-like NDP-sugar epimerase
MNFLKDLKILPRWVIASLDTFLLFQAAMLGFVLRFNFDFSQVQASNAFLGSLYFALSGALVMLFTKSYKGIVRHTGLKDSLQVFRTVSINSGMVLVLNIVLDLVSSGGYIIPISVLVIATLTSLFLLIIYRLLVKELFLYLKSGFVNNVKRSAVLYGASEVGIKTLEVLNTDPKSQIEVVAILDDDPKKVGKVIGGIKIFRGLEHLNKLASTTKLSELIIAVDGLSVQKKKEILEACFKWGIHVSIIPSVNKWIKSSPKDEIVRDLKIEDLLGREQISLDNPKIMDELTNKVVLVTGAAGSIGSELCRQIMHYNPKLLLMVDFSESSLYELEIEVSNSGFLTKSLAILADVRDKDKMKSIFAEHRPEMVFHAAAYKHVPMIESYPQEAIRSNVLGTKILADLAVIYMVEKFVFVSTDKAVNPTNVMGATKRAAEMYVQSLNIFLENHHGNNHTKFITTRFGNVLGSNGSVVPMFKKQLLQGGPIKVTHPEVTRYFMTIPEACQLVLEAGAMGEGGEIYVFDMGEPIKIYDLAVNMVHLSGKKVGEDIQIVFTGLREGEKLYEELLNHSELVKITHHPKIKIAKVAPVHYYKIEGQIDLFEKMLGRSTDNDLVFHLKSIIPEFKSNVSRFEVLDRLN